MKWLFFVLAGLATTGVLHAQAAADPYAITPQAGPWSICVASFTGELAAKQAHDLVTELRTQYRLPAYLFNRGDDQRREQETEIQKKRQQQEDYLRKAGLNPADIPLRARRARIEDQYAVLVGGYPDIEAAHRELQKVKKLQEPKSVPKDVIYQNQEGRIGRLNPFTNSFVARNPTAPLTRAAANEPDPFWKELNADEPYSLLKCKHPWTYAVKEFQGATMVQAQNAPSSGFLDKLFGKHGGEQLSASAQNAHNLAEALRKANLDAYVLHTRSSSIVTVGGFDNLEDPTIQPVLQRVRAILAPDKVKISSDNPRLMQGNDLSVGQPRPMPVPRF